MEVGPWFLRLPTDAPPPLHPSATNPITQKCWQYVYRMEFPKKSWQRSQSALKITSPLPTTLPAHPSPPPLIIRRLALRLPLPCPLHILPPPTHPPHRFYLPSPIIRRLTCWHPGCSRRELRLPTAPEKHFQRRVAIQAVSVVTGQASRLGTVVTPSKLPFVASFQKKKNVHTHRIIQISVLYMQPLL